MATFPFVPEDIIPAYPGFFALVLIDGGKDGWRVWRIPVVAFAMNIEGYTLPVGPHGLIYEDRHDAIQNPDGTVETCEMKWESVAAFLAEVTKTAGG